MSMSQALQLSPSTPPAPVCPPAPPSAKRPRRGYVVLPVHPGENIPTSIRRLRAETGWRGGVFVTAACHAA